MKSRVFLSFVTILSISSQNILADETKENNLSEIEVQSSLLNKMTNKNFSNDANLGLLGDRDIRDIPISITTFSDDSIKNKVARQLSDVITQDSSVRSSGAVGDNAESFYIRGIPLGDNNLGEFAFDGIYGIAPNYKVSTDLFQAVSVIKGPASTFFGMSPLGASGGVINLVPKRPYADLANLGLRYTSKSRFGATVDVSNRFGDEKKYGARFNLAYDDGKPAVDNLKDKGLSAALSLDYVSDSFYNSFDFMSIKEDIKAPFRRLSLSGSLTEPPKAPKNSFNTAQSWEFSNYKENLGLYKFDYIPNDNFQVGFYMGGAKSSIKRLFQQSLVIQNSSGDAIASPSAAQFDVSRLVFGAKAGAKFETGIINHDLNLGLDSFYGLVKRSYNPGSYISYMTNIYNPANALEQDFVLRNSSLKNLKTQLSSLALIDTISDQDRIYFFSFGGRFQNIKTTNYDGTGSISTKYDESAFVPFLGFTYKPIEYISLYANYSQGLAGGDAAPSYARNFGEVFKPYKAQQIEAGIKYGLNDTYLSFALFDMDKRSGEYDALSRSFSDTKKALYRGVELTAFTKITDMAMISSGVTFLNTKVKETALNSNILGGTPKVLANVGLDLDIPFVRGLSFGNYLIYSQKQYARDGSDIALPSWARWDLGLKYSTNKDKLTVIFNIENVTNKGYWEGASQYGQISSGIPRTFMLSFNYAI